MHRTLTGGYPHDLKDTSGCHRHKKKDDITCHLILLHISHTGLYTQCTVTVQTTRPPLMALLFSLAHHKLLTEYPRKGFLYPIDSMRKATSAGRRREVGSCFVLPLSESSP